MVQEAQCGPDSTPTSTPSSGKLNSAESADLHDQAASISSETVDAVAAVVAKLGRATDYGELIDEGFGQAMRAEASVRHIRRELPFGL
jgi:hypothetical protein